MVGAGPTPIISALTSLQEQPQEITRERTRVPRHWPYTRFARWLYLLNQRSQEPEWGRADLWITLPVVPQVVTLTGIGVNPNPRLSFWYARSALKLEQKLMVLYTRGTEDASRKKFLNG
jgi:hypothetical protein